MTAHRHAFIVESDHAVRDRVRSHLAGEGFAVGEAHDGATAIERTGRERFDLIVLDRTNGDVDGVTLCRAIRARGQNTATPMCVCLFQDSDDRVATGLGQVLQRRPSG